MVDKCANASIDQNAHLLHVLNARAKESAFWNGWWNKYEQYRRFKKVTFHSYACPSDLFKVTLSLLMQLVWYN